MSFPSMNKMPIIEHRIDPEPDTVIKSYNPCVDFAPWEVPVPPHAAATAEERGLSATPSTTRTRKKTAITEKKKSAKGKRSSQIASDANVTANVGASLFGGDSSDVPTESSSAANVEAPIDDKQEREASVLYYVSSRHLILASTWFRRALVTEKWAESKRNEKDGLIHIEADDWDSNAFLIFLNIIHLKSQHLTTVDPVPATYCRNLTLWICSAWVFEWKDQFNEATLVAIRQCSEPMRALGLPIPQRVFDEIDLKRYQAMENVIENLHDLRRKYESLDYVCPQNSTYSFNCGSMLYGAISKEMLAVQILSPRPEIPFTGLSFEQLCSAVRKFKGPTSSGSGYSSGYYNSYSHHQAQNCSLTTAVMNVIDNVASTVVGFHLQSLKKSDFDWP